MEIVKDVKDLISKAKTEKAISKLKEFTKDKNGKIPDAILLIETDFNLFNQKKIIGELTMEQERAQVIRINNQILNFVNTYINEDGSLKIIANINLQKHNTPQRKNILKNIFLPVILSLIFSLIIINQNEIQISENEDKVGVLMLPFLFIFTVLCFIFLTIIGLFTGESVISCAFVAIIFVIFIGIFVSYKKGFTPSILTFEIIKNTFKL